MARLILVEGNQLADVTEAAILVILLSSAGVTQMHKMMGPKVRVMATKKVTVKAMIVPIFGVTSRPLVRIMS